MPVHEATFFMVSRPKGRMDAEVETIPKPDIGCGSSTAGSIASGHRMKDENCVTQIQ
jgi:hypothetical protein